MLIKLIGSSLLLAFCILSIREITKGDGRRIANAMATVKLMKYILSSVSLYRTPMNEILERYEENDNDIGAIIAALDDREALTGYIGEEGAGCLADFLRDVRGGDALSSAKRYIDELESLTEAYARSRRDRHKLVRDVMLSVTLMAIILLI